MKASVLSIIALSCCSVAYANAVPEPLVTPAPVAPRQLMTEFDSFIGYYSTHGTYDAVYCDEGATVAFGDTNAGCCSIGDFECPVITRCKGSTVYFDDGYVTTCPDYADSCVTDYLLVSTSDSLGWYWVGCATDSKPHTIYVEYPGDETGAPTAFPTAAETTDASPAAASSTLGPTSTLDSASTSTDASSTAQSKSFSGIPTSATTAIAAPVSSHKSSSKAWIAGAVLGPLLFLLALGALAFFLIRRRRSTPNPYVENEPTFQPPPAPYSPPQQHEQAYSMDMVSPLPAHATPVSPMGIGPVSPISTPLEPAPAYSEYKGAHVYQYAPVPATGDTGPKY